MSKCLSKAFHSSALISYLTLGEYSIDFTLQSCRTLIENGVDVIELGLPFSDPIADGPVIQQSHQRALSTTEDVSVDTAFDVIRQIKIMSPDIPIVIMSATNLIMHYGYAEFFKNGQTVGCDGLILPDCSIEMADSILPYAQASDISWIQLVSPLSNADRIKSIVSIAEGFVYLVSSTGITGERNQFSDNLRSCVEQIKCVKEIPVAVGFGIHDPVQAHELCEFVDGVIVGSHFVKLMNSVMPDKEKALQVLADRVRAFKHFNG